MTEPVDVTAETPPKTAFPPGTLGITSGALTRYAAFWSAMMALDIPPGSHYHLTQSCSVVDNCNIVVRDMRGDWLVFWGDDHVFPPDYLMQMLSLMYQHDLDILAPVCVRRTHPWNIVVYDRLGAADGWDHVLDLGSLPEDTKLVEVAGAGTAGMVIRRRVFDAMDDPWFKGGPMPNGGTFQLAEDLRFCLEARDLGFHIYCAPEILIGHITSVKLWVEKHPEHGFGLRVELDDDNSIYVPQGAIT